MKLTSRSTEETIALGTALGRVARPDTIVSLTGDLGAGKTHFSKGVAAGLGISDDITSPTFNILLEYAGGRLPLFHFDLYRLTEPDELEDIGFYEALESGGVCLIEWGNRFPDALPDDLLSIDIALGAGDERMLEVKAGGPTSLAVLDLFGEYASC